MVVYVDFSSRAAEPTPPTPLPTLNDAHPIRGAIVLYPFLASLSAHLDLTDLHNLSMTCQHLHRTLSDYRSTLLTLSLRCQYAPPSPTPNFWRSRGRCARDLVQCCIRCQKPTCRNCVQKPTLFKARLRRLCPPCQRDPAPPGEICHCDTDAWTCPPCSQEFGKEDTGYLMHCSGVASEGRGLGVVNCARGGRECVGLSGDDDEDWSVDGVDEAAEPQMEDDEEWDSLGEAINAQGEEMWEDLDVQLSGPRKKRRGGRVLKWDREVCDEMPLREEIRGEVRAFCSWCEGTVLSKEQKTKGLGM